MQLYDYVSSQYHYWGKLPCGNENFLSIAREILQQGGFHQFFVGTKATVKRDLIFGGCFALLRHEFLPILIRKSKNAMEHAEAPNSSRKRTDFAINMIAATVATILSSPMNYVRNIHYATDPSSKPATSIQILRELVHRANHENPTWSGRVHFMQQMLRLGWGTLRVGCGMAVGAMLYDFFATLVT